jgi:hypothetical protein
MSGFNYIFQGPPSGVVAPGQVNSAAIGYDTTNNVIYASSGKGWIPVAGTSGKVDLAALVANNTNVLTFTALSAGLYQVNLYEISANTPTGATLPAITVVYTDNETATSVTDTLADVASVSSEGVVNQGSFIVNVAAAGTIVVATTSYAAGSGTALAYNIKVRIVHI